MRNRKQHISKLVKGLLLLMVPLFLPLFSGAQSITNLDTQLPGSAGPWATWGGATTDLSAHPGYLRVMVQPNSVSGVEIPLGIALAQYPPPWHMEVAIERPTNINTAIGFLSVTDGLEAVFMNLTNSTGSFFAGASTNASGLGAPPVPDFSSVPSSAMSGPRLIFYIGMSRPDAAGYSTMIWGVRTNESAPWSFAPPVNFGFDATQSPTFWNDWKLAIETRNSWFSQFGTNVVGPATPSYVDINYIKFYPNATPPISAWDADFSSGTTGPWRTFGAASGVVSNGYWVVTTPPQSFGGLELPNGISLANYPPPWHMEVSVVRPLNQNSAVGFISQYDGIQAFFDNLTNGIYNFAGATWNGTGYTPTLPSWSGQANPVGGTAFNSPSYPFMAGTNLIFYVGMVDNSNMVWGVRNGENAPWHLSAVQPQGYDMAAIPLWDDWKVAIETRTPWYQYVGGANASGPTNNTVLDFKYIHFYDSNIVVVPTTPTLTDLGVDYTQGVPTTNNWAPFSASSVLTANANEVTVSPGTFGGMALGASLLLSNYPPPWRMIVALDRPTNVNSAFGLLSQDSGVQATFYNLADTGAVGFQMATGWAPPVPGIPAPDFSAIPASNMSGSHLEFMMEMLSNTKMVWGVRSSDNPTWAFTPVDNVGIDMRTNGFFGDMKFFVDERPPFYGQFTNASGGTELNDTNPITINLDYVKFIPGVVAPAVPTLTDLGVDYTQGVPTTNNWAPFSASSVLTANANEVTLQPGTFGGMALGASLLLSNYPPPWQMIVALDRPTNVNSALGLLSLDSGVQSTFYSLADTGAVGFQMATGWAPPVPGIPAPDFSAIPASNMSGSHLEFLMEMLSDTNMVWGVRSSDNPTWAFTPVDNVGLDMRTNNFFGDMKIFVDERPPFYGQFTNASGGTELNDTNPITINLDYVKFIPGLGNLSVKGSGTNVILTWPGAGNLQSANSVSGPWSDVPGSPASPATIPSAGSSVYYRLRQQQ